MYAVIVQIKAIPDKVEEFVAAIRSNAEASLANEPGCLRFDVLKVEGSPNEFYLYELYQDAEAFQLHRAAPHFAQWRSAVAEYVIPGGQVILQGNPAFEGAIAE